MKFDDLKSYQRAALTTVKAKIDKHFENNETTQTLDLDTANVIITYTGKTPHLVIQTLSIEQENKQPIKVTVCIRRRENGNFFIANLNYSILVTRNQTFDIKCHNYAI